MKLIQIIIAGFLMAAATWMIRNAPAQALSDTSLKSITVPHNVRFCWESNCWLLIQRHNTKDYGNQQFDPCYTNIVSDYKPIVKRQGKQWEIVFVSEIAEELP